MVFEEDTPRWLHPVALPQPHTPTQMTRNPMWHARTTPPDNRPRSATSAQRHPTSAVRVQSEPLALLHTPTHAHDCNARIVPRPCLASSIYLCRDCGVTEKDTENPLRHSNSCTTQRAVCCTHDAPREHRNTSITDGPLAGYPGNASVGNAGQRNESAPEEPEPQHTQEPPDQYRTPQPPIFTKMVAIEVLRVCLWAHRQEMYDTPMRTNHTA